MQRVYEKDLVEIHEVSPQVYFRKADLRTRNQCNGAYFLSEGVVGVVDVPTMEAAEEMEEESRLLFGQPISRVFLTHGHEDHVGGLPAFLRQNVTIFCSEHLLERMQLKRGDVAATLVGVKGRIPVRMADLEIECRALEVSAHSWGDMLVSLPGRCLCTGDFVVDYPFFYFHSANVENWIAQLGKISAEGGEHVIPGHGDIFPFSRIAESADFIQSLARAARDCLSGLTETQIESLSEQTIHGVVSAYFSAGNADARRIHDLAGRMDAHRELRMVVRYFAYAKLF